MATIELTRSKIHSFTELPLGWHYGEGVPAEQKTVDAALAILRQAAAAGFSKADAFPGIEGEVRVTLYEQAYYYEFTVERNASVTVVCEHQRQEVLALEDLSLEEALQKLEEFGVGIWDCSELFTPAISIPAVATSKV